MEKTGELWFYFVRLRFTMYVWPSRQWIIGMSNLLNYMRLLLLYFSFMETMSLPLQKMENVTKSLEAHNTTTYTAMATNETLNRSSNLTTASPHADVPPKCTYEHQEFCHPYIRNVFVMYTGIGGWVLLTIVLTCVLLQVVVMARHKMYQRKNNV